MKIRAAYRGLNCPDLSDSATQSVALKCGPTATPDIFIFDQQRKLRYQELGSIDNNSREDLVVKREARDALDAVLCDTPVAIEATPAVGCSTKWPIRKRACRRKFKLPRSRRFKLDMGRS
jgi:hypothetical protein